MFRLRIAALSIIAFLVSMESAHPADKPTPTAWTPELMMQVKQVSSVQVAPDGKRVAYTVRQAVMDGDKSEYLTHIHLANADGSEPRQLTEGDKSSDHPRWSPDGQAIAYLAVHGGKRNLSLIPARGGEARRLTNSKGGVSSLKWSPDGKSIAFTAMDALTPQEEMNSKAKNDARVVDENIKMSRLYVILVAKAGEPRLLTQGAYCVGNETGADRRGGYDWSPDGRTIVFSHTRTPNPDDWPRRTPAAAPLS